MEGVKELFEKSFDFTSPIVLFPIRHHSPACSYHLKKTIEAYQPEVILIEGPRNATYLIEDLCKEGNKTPFCLYLSFDDTQGILGEEKEKYRAYYPMLSYSPEYVAMQMAKKLHIPAEFIDLAYHEKLLNSEKLEIEKGMLEEEDARLSIGTYYQSLCEKEGCRNFNELWEKLFETKGLRLETKAFVKQVFTYCYYTRLTEQEEELRKSGDLSREAYMYHRIMEASKTYHKILVVTGGMHTIALTEKLSDKADTTSFRLIEQEVPTYLMPYSFEESDNLKGYASGMAFPYFYERVWEVMEKGKKTPYEETLLKFLVELTKMLRKKQATSITDEMQAYYMAMGLAALREKAMPGVFELIDGVQSAFIKGERNVKYEPILGTLFKLMSGLKMGTVKDTQNMPPIVQDFFEQCKGFKIPINVATAKEIKLDVYQKKQHRDKSCFLAQMQYLETTFCTYMKGQDERMGVGRILLHETWQYRYTPKVYAALIDQSIFAGTVRGAAFYLLAKNISREYHTTETLTRQLDLAEKMGMDELYSVITDSLEEIILQDMNFVSVAGGFVALSKIITRMKMREREETNSLRWIKRRILERVIRLMDDIRKVSADDEKIYCDLLKSIHEYFLVQGEQEEEEHVQHRWLECVRAFFDDQEANSTLVGVMTGILLKKEAITVQQAMEKFEWYLQGSEKVKKEAAAFLKGFFYIAKDTIFTEPQIIYDIDHILWLSEGETFLKILPELSLAFTAFLPFEIDKIADKVAMLYGVSGAQILYEQAVDPMLLSFMKKQDSASYEVVHDWLVFESDNVVEAEEEMIERLTEEGLIAHKLQYSEADKREQLNKWRLILGRFADQRLTLDSEYGELDQTLQFLYSREYSEAQGVRNENGSGGSKMGGRTSSGLSVVTWLSKVRALFPKETVEIMQKQALEKYKISELLMDKEILEKLQPDMTLLKNILCFKNQMKGDVIETARKIVRQVVEEIKQQLEREVKESFSGKRNPYKSSQLRTMRNFDFKKTVRRNLKNYDVQTQTLIPDQIYFCSRQKRYNPYEIFIVVDESGSMMESVIYSAVMAGIFSGLSMLKTNLIIFDTRIVDLTDYVSDPVEALMNVELGGGTDISSALAYTQKKITMPQRSIVVLVSDLYDGYHYDKMYKCVDDMIESGVKMFVLPALDYECNGSYCKNAAQQMANRGAHVAAITPKELANWIAKIVL